MNFYNPNNSPNKSPYYIENIKEEVLISLGINYEIINNINSININKFNEKNKDYLDKFKKVLIYELEYLFNMYTMDYNDSTDFQNEINIHVNNLNELSNFVNNVIETF